MQESRPQTSCRRHFSNRAARHRQACQKLHIVKTVAEGLPSRHTSTATRFRQDISRQPVWIPLKATCPQIIRSIFQLLLTDISKFALPLADGCNKRTVRSSRACGPSNLSTLRCKSDHAFVVLPKEGGCLRSRCSSASFFSLPPALAGGIG